MPAFEWVHAAPKGDDKFITTDYLQQCHFDDYLLPAEKFAALKREQALPLAINPNSDQYLEERLQLLTSSWPPSPAWPRTTSARCHPHRVGAENHPLDAAVPDRAQALIDQTASYCRASRSPNC
ncbi:Putative transposase (identified by ISEscan HMM) [Klebsiella pneumoniae]|nr:Putative transposase (identified by ISEscan HMM) [Klebsiella pneumoniae]